MLRTSQRCGEVAHAAAESRPPAVVQEADRADGRRPTAGRHLWRTGRRSPPLRLLVDRPRRAGDADRALGRGADDAERCRVRAVTCPGVQGEAGPQLSQWWWCPW